MIHFSIWYSLAEFDNFCWGINMFEIQGTNVRKIWIVELTINAKMTYVSNLVKMITTALMKISVWTRSACPRYVKMMLIVALETSVLIKHAKSNVSQIRIVQREKNVLMIFVLFHGVKNVIKNQVTFNFTCLQQNSMQSF